MGVQYLNRFLRDVGSFNLGVPGQGNPLGNNIGADFALKQPPDGYTLFLVNPANGINHTLYKNLPTNLNNVETWANVAQIIERGADWYAGIGTEGSKGTKLVSLSGHVVNSGVVEVPMGTPLRRIVEDIGGGAAHGKAIKAVHFGGPMGGSIPARLIDARLDFDELARRVRAARHAEELVEDVRGLSPGDRPGGPAKCAWQVGGARTPGGRHLY